MADERIKDFGTESTQLAADDYFALDGTTSGTTNGKATRFFGDSVIFVQAEADFGVDTGTGWQLVAFKHYVLTAEVELTKSLLVPADGPIEISSRNWAASSIETVGTFDIFKGATAFGIYMHNLVINGEVAKNTTLFNLISGGSSVAFAITSGVCAFTNLASIGRIEGFNSVDMANMSFNGFDAGLTIDDNATFFGNILVFESGVTTGIADVTIEGTSDVVVFDKCRHSGSANTVAYDIDSASGVTDGKIINCSYVDNGGDFTEPAGLGRTDPNWEMMDNGDAKDSRNVAAAYVAATQTITVAASSTFYEVGGTAFTSKIAERFSVSTAGVITYNGVRSIDVAVSAVATVQKTGGGSNVIEGRIAKNWTTAGTGEVDSAAQTESVDPTSIPIQTIMEIDPSDNIRIIFSNNSGTADIEVDLANFIIQET